MAAEHTENRERTLESCDDPSCRKPTPKLGNPQASKNIAGSQRTMEMAFSLFHPPRLHRAKYSAKHLLPPRNTPLA
jgi:hypothetical protein